MNDTPLCSECYQPLVVSVYMTGAYYEPCVCTINKRELDDLINWNDAYDEGKEEGYNNGYSDGHQEGYKKAMRHYTEDEEEYSDRIGV